MKDMEYLHLARGTYALDPDDAPLHNEEAFARLAFAEEICALLKTYYF
jgi:hypothetical protein